MKKLERILTISFMFFIIVSCGVRKEKLIIEKNYKNQALNTTNILTDKCAWFYRNVQLNENQIDSIKTILYKDETSLKVRTVSSIRDSINKYKVEEDCLVILE